MLGALLIGAVAAAPATATTPPACSEYLSLPGCAGGGGGGTPVAPGGGGGGSIGGGRGGAGAVHGSGSGRTGNGSQARAPASRSVPKGASSPRGEFPFTDYPLTPLVLLLLLILVAALLVRAYVGVRDRARSRRAVRGAPPFGST